MRVPVTAEAGEVPEYDVQEPAAGTPAAVDIHDGQRTGKYEVSVAWKNIMGSPDGQTILRDLVQRFGFARQSTFVSGDPYGTTLNEGCRVVLVHIGRMIEGEVPEEQEDRSET